MEIPNIIKFGTLVSLFSGTIFLFVGINGTYNGFNGIANDSTQQNQQRPKICLSKINYLNNNLKLKHNSYLRSKSIPYPSKKSKSTGVIFANNTAYLLYYLPQQIFNSSVQNENGFEQINLIITDENLSADIYEVNKIAIVNSYHFEFLNSLNSFNIHQYDSSFIIEEIYFCDDDNIKQDIIRVVRSPIKPSEEIINKL